MQIWINKENFILSHQKSKALADFCGRPMSQACNQSHAWVKKKKMGGTDEIVVIVQRPRMTQFGQ